MTEVGAYAFRRAPEKTCSICGETKPRAEFDRKGGAGSDRRRSYCHECGKVKKNARRARPEQRAKRTRYLRTKTYSIDADALWAEQDGACAFCEEPLGVLDATVHVDHDHSCCDGPTSCGACVRGLVHRECNSRIAGIERRLRNGETLDTMEREVAERATTIARAMQYLMHNRCIFMHDEGAWVGTSEGATARGIEAA